MSIPASGTIKRSGGVVSALNKQLRLLQLSPVDQILFTFDPLHDNAKEVRSLLHLLSAPKITEKNPNCRFKTTVVCDRSEPTVNFKLIQGAAEKLGVSKVTFKSNNLTCLEILKIYNKHITPLAVPVEETPAADLKASKKVKGKK